MEKFMEQLTRRYVLGAAVAGGGLLLASPLFAAKRPPMITYRDPGCGCCIKWVEAMRRAGFAVTVRETTEMMAVKRRLKVPEALASCHTTTVGPLVVEGHVPAAAILQLLAKRPAGVLGISAPGMPRGSPGMEMPDGSRDPLNLTLFSASGQTRRFG